MKLFYKRNKFLFSVFLLGMRDGRKKRKKKNLRQREQKRFSIFNNIFPNN